MLYMYAFTCDDIACSNAGICLVDFDLMSRGPHVHKLLLQTRWPASKLKMTL